VKINFVGNFAHGYVGEVADETHLARNLGDLGCEVKKCPRDVWKAHCDGEKDKTWGPLLPGKADANIVAKWHHFNDEKYIEKLRKRSGGPVFYWVWDYMQNEDWHVKMVKASDVYLSNDVFSGHYKDFDNAYYFPFDVADEEIQVFLTETIQRDVVFFGSHIPQGDRVEWLKIINKEVPVHIYAWNADQWRKDGFRAFDAVYDFVFNKQVARTKICLQFSVNDHCWGYWSNRVGKTLLAGGFLLARYAPGMELFLKDGVAYFNSPQEAIEKIKFYLSPEGEGERQQIQRKGFELGRTHFSSKQRCKELILLIQNYLKNVSTQKKS